MKKGHIILGVILLIGLFVFIPNGAADDEGLLADWSKSHEEAETSSQERWVISPDKSPSWEISYDDVDVDEDKDEDKDEVLDDKDKCLGTLPEVAVDEKGCPKVMEMEVRSPTHNKIYSPEQECIFVEGYVWNKEGGHPVEGVKIKTDLYVEGSEGWDLKLNPTNPEGYYSYPFPLEDIPQGIYTLRVTASKTGYPAVSKTIKNITIGGVTNTDNDCETPVKKTQVEILKEIHEIIIKSMELRVAKSINEVYSDKYAKSVIEIQRRKGIIKTKDNEIKIMRLSDGKSSLQLIISPNTECEVETLRGGSLWVKVKDGVVGVFTVETQQGIQKGIYDLKFSTDNAEVTSDHTKFETSYDPASKITTVTVFEDYVTVKSLKTNDPEMIVSAGQRIEITDEGFSPKLELTQDDLMCLADRYTVAFGGINPLLISTNNPPIASFSIMPQNPKTSDTIVVASTSFDPDDDKLTYSWYRDGIYLTEIGDWSDWEWENPQAGEHTIKLVVDDGKGGSDEYSTKIMVIGPTPPVIPGFEIALLISAIVVALIVIKRRKHNL